VGAAYYMSNMFLQAELSTANYDSLLIGWSSQPLYWSVDFNGGNSQYCSQEAIDARDSLIYSKNWNIQDLGHDIACVPVGLVDNNAINLIVSPNPASTFIEIQLTENTEGILSLIDVAGRVIERQILDGGKDVYFMDISKYGQGTYFIEIQGEENIIEKILFQ